MKITAIIILTLIPFLSFSQKYKRNTFKYEKLKSENFAECDDSTNSILEKSFIAIEQNNSRFAVDNSKGIYDNKKDCYQVFEVYGYSLFKNGNWFEGLEIIEEGINKFGSVPSLILRKYKMSLEMAYLGTGQKNIDGSSVYKANSIDYDEEQFRAENYRSALVDLEYLIKEYNRSEEIFYAAKVHQILKQYEKSTEFFSKLLTDEEFKYDASYNIADNYIVQNKLTEAEIELNKLLSDSPREGMLYEKLAEVYEKKNDATKSNEYQQKAIYYYNVPDFLDLEYSDENFELLLFFGTDEKTVDEKMNKLNTLFEKSSQERTIDVCLMILKLHANHGNGVEERATEVLKEIGKPTIEKVNKLFQLDVSTCTITSLADVMAIVKDENSWKLMKQYLPSIVNMPITLTPPNLPAMMIQFDEENGVREILIVVKPLLTAKKENKNSNDPMADLKGFGQYVFYSPLKEIDRTKLKEIAKELNYSDEEFILLEEKVK